MSVTSDPSQVDTMTLHASMQRDICKALDHSKAALPMSDVIPWLREAIATATELQRREGNRS